MHSTGFQPLTRHEQVLERARQIASYDVLPKVVVAAAEEDDVLSALNMCYEQGIADAILVGNDSRVRAALDAAKVPEDRFEILPTGSDEESAIIAAKLAAEGQAQVVMKGYLKTGTLLKTLLKSEYGLRDRELVSHSAVLDVSNYGKLLNITDGGTLPVPNLEQKLTIIANGVSVMRAVGVDRPRIAVLGPADEVRDDLPATREAAELVNRARERFGDSIMIEGPMTVSHAVTYPVYSKPETVSEVAGKADILAVSTLEEGNIIAKTLIQFGGAVFMGVIAGARVPISLVSRSDTMTNKMASVALAACLSHSQRTKAREVQA
jgi:phosphate butyryltransferase